MDIIFIWILLWMLLIFEISDAFLFFPTLVEFSPTAFWHSYAELGCFYVPLLFGPGVQLSLHLFWYTMTSIRVDGYDVPLFVPLSDDGFTRVEAFELSLKFLIEVESLCCIPKYKYSRI